MTSPVPEVVKYGPVDLVIEENRHRFETRMTFERWAGVVAGLVGLALVVFLVVITIADPLFVILTYAMAGLASLVSLTTISFSLFRKVVLSFTPDGMTVEMRGTLPLARPGKWTWGLEEFAGMAIDVLPMFSRGSTFVKCGVQLCLRGSDSPRRLFFVFDSRKWAEALQADITTSWRLMVERHNARVGGGQQRPSP